MVLGLSRFMECSKELGLHKQCDIAIACGSYHPSLHPQKNDLCVIRFTGIKHVFSCINICQVLRKTLHTEDEAGYWEHLPKDMALVNALKHNRP